MEICMLKVLLKLKVSLIKLTSAYLLMIKIKKLLFSSNIGRHEHRMRLRIDLGMIIRA